MSVKEQFYNQRPAVLFDPRASQRIDPRFKFTRDGAASYTDRDGVLQVNGAPANQPRVGFNYEPGSDGVLQLVQGIALEEQGTNLLLNSANFNIGFLHQQTTRTESALNSPDDTTTATLVVPNTQLGSHASFLSSLALIPLTVYSFTLFAKSFGYNHVQLAFTSGFGNLSAFANFLLTGSGSVVTLGTGQTASIKALANGWYRCSITARSGVAASLGGPAVIALDSNRDARDPSFSGNNVDGVYFWGAQLEVGASPTSYIPTTTATVTRPADLLSFNTEVPSSGSLYIDAEASSAGVGNTLLSAANASDEKLLLQVQQPANLYNGIALVYSIDESFEPTLPFPIPEPGAQRNIITWGANNFHYQQSNYRKTPSLTAAVPESMKRIGIGHDITDPTKGFNGVISRLYLWANELPPEIARGLVRGNITVPFNTDDGNIIPTDAQVFVFNTQGDTFTGDKVVRFQLLGSNNSVSIDWGDGSVETYTGSAANAIITHTYETAGLYLVSITGVFENIKLAGFTGSQASDLASVLQNSPDWSPTNLTDLYNGCSLITSDSLDDFPDTSLITQFLRAFTNCSSLTSFPLINTAAGTNFSNAWNGCSSLTSFPLIDTSAGTSFQSAWNGCSSLTSFPLINTSASTTFQGAWRDCSSLTSFPLINTATSTNFRLGWLNCSSLTSFPLIDTSAGTNLQDAWSNCSSLTSFPLINTSASTTFQGAWRDCSSLTSFPLINTSASTTFQGAWRDCSSLTSFPLINTAAGTSYLESWRSCSSLTSFPLINTAAGTNFCRAWFTCLGLTAFPALNFDAAVGLASDADNTFTGFRETWRNCTALADFPANLFDNTTCTRYLDAFNGCALTAQSIENILVSINTANTSNGNLGLSGGTNAVKTSWTANANTAYDALVARGWTITFRP
jgi:hypothetical protein